ncbi:MAG: lysylphosphatidylglycerol synthase transmembrane domain-containing protein [Candidatus Bathyarchaeia archaeon]
MFKIKKTTLARLGRLLFGALVLVTLLYYVRIDQVERAISQVKPAVIVVMVGFQVLGVVFYAGAWYVLIKALGYKLRFLTCQGVTFASIFVNYITPSGFFLEATRCILGAKASGMKLGESTATVILHRTLYIAAVLASTAVAILTLMVSGFITGSAIMELAIVPVSAIAVLVIFLYLSLTPTALRPVLDGLLRLVQPLIKVVRRQANVEGKADQFLDEYGVGFRKMLASKPYVALSFLVSLGDWSSGVAVLWVALLGLNVYVPFSAVVITVAIGEIIEMIPIDVPGTLGIYEAAITASLSVFSIPIAVAASAALLTRVVISVLELPITGVAAYHYDIKALGNPTAPVQTYAAR